MRAGNDMDSGTDTGKVYLVGAGPGDPELLTLKAYRLLQSADAVVHDRLVSQEILALIPDGVACMDVGKSTGNHHAKQGEINHLLVKLARAGRNTVRLKGGDPYVFGRGGEEALELARAGICFEVVPGISAAQACAAYAGIPLTHRGLSHSVRIMTGHRCDNHDEQFDVACMADSQQTLVFYMGIANAAPIVSALYSAGRDAATPAAIVQCGSTPQQRTLVTSLEHLVETIQRELVTPPALLMVGPTVDLSAELGWYQPSSARSFECVSGQWLPESYGACHA